MSLSIYTAGGAGGGSSLVADARATILASSPTTDSIAYATDTNEFFIYDLTNTEWRVAPLELEIITATPDIGLQPPTVLSDKAGYTSMYITDKGLYNIHILGNNLTEHGAIRTTTDGVYQVYLNGQWNDVVVGFRLREDENIIFEHQPIIDGEWLEINSGNSNTLGLNGLPLVQQYGISIGIYPVKLQIDGGTE